MSDTTPHPLDAIFKAKSVAVIGASRTPGKWGGMIIRSAANSGFRGRIYPVNPKEDIIMGLKAYPDVLDIPDDVDLAVFTVPAAHMPGIMKNCVKKGIKGGVIISADFAETGDDGRALQEETVRIAREGGLRFVGPNGNGIWTSAVRLNLSPFPSPMPGSIAFVSQSGSFGGVAARAAASQGFGLSKFISMGNQADLNAADYLEYLGEDKDTSVIALYLEGIKDGRRFFEIARSVSQKKPVLIYKGGKSDQAARAALSHTASIAGTDKVFDSMCRQAGMIRVFEVGHLFTMAEGLMRQPIPKGPNVAILADGGQGVAILDNLAAQGVNAPEFKQEDKHMLKALMPPHAPVPQNPVDFAAGAMEAMDEVKVIEALASLDYIDAIITNLPSERSLKRISLADQKREAIAALDRFTQIPTKFGKPVVALRWFVSPTTSDIVRAGNIPVFDNQEDAARAMAALIRYYKIKSRA